MNAFFETIRKYFRLKVEGLEHIPKKGSALITPNHSGYAGFDALVLGYEIRRSLKRIPRILAHHFWFTHKMTAYVLKKMGMADATLNNGLELLKRKHLVIIFPEGEKGNFKPSRQKYRLQEFKRGFIRMAIQTKSPIIPAIIVGAEETHINLAELKFAKYLVGAILPLPLNVIPLPAKWKIKFLPPIYLDYPESVIEDSDLMNKISRQIKDTMQFHLNLEVRKRTYKYFR